MTDADMGARFLALDERFVRLEATLHRLDAENASLKRARNAALALAVLALAGLLLVFFGVLSPRWKRLHVEQLETTEVRTVRVVVADPAVKGRAMLSVFGDSASLSLNGEGSTVTATASSEGFLALDTKHEQSIYLTTSSNPVLGATVVTTSKDVRAELHANRNSGEEAGLSLRATGTTELVARTYQTQGDAFVGGLSVTNELKAKVNVGLGSGDAHVLLERRTGGVHDTATLETSASQPPQLFLVHRKEGKPSDDTTIGAVALAGKPWIFGVAGDKDAWKLTSTQK